MNYAVSVLHKYFIYIQNSINSLIDYRMGYKNGGGENCNMKCVKCNRNNNLWEQFLINWPKTELNNKKMKKKKTNKFLMC